MVYVTAWTRTQVGMCGHRDTLMAVLVSGSECMNLTLPLPFHERMSQT